MKGAVHNGTEGSEIQAGWKTSSKSGGKWSFFPIKDELSAPVQLCWLKGVSRTTWLLWEGKKESVRDPTEM